MMPVTTSAATMDTHTSAFRTVMNLNKFSWRWRFLITGGDGGGCGEGGGVTRIFGGLGYSYFLVVFVEKEVC